VKQTTNPLANAWADHNRAWQDNTYVYPVISRRAGGISIGINLNLDKACTFDCPYCQVDRTQAGDRRPLDLDTIQAELEAMISAYRSNGLADFPSFQAIPAQQRILRDLCLSGDGESTMVPEFAAVCTRLRNIQQSHDDLNLKLVLISNATLLHQPHVIQGLEQLCATQGEIWGKLDAGTEEWFQRVNISRHHLDSIERNLSQTVEKFPMRIQTMLCTLDNEMPSENEMNAYIERVCRIRDQAPHHFLGVQLYSVVRSTARLHVGPVPLAFLENTALRLQKHSPGIQVGIYP
jgi:wyosine [tRNA(Phe)-imidazoG37] synthetase (radical SAM superfamily)